LACDFPEFDEMVQKLSQRSLSFVNSNQKKKKK
jgi:hypothetical protein